MSDGNIQFIKTTRPKDTYPWREWIPEESTVGTPQQSIASEAPGHNSVHADTRSYWPEIELNPGSEIAGIDHDTALVLPTASPVPLFPAAHEPTRIEEQHISSVVSRDLSEDCTLVSEEPQEKSATTSSDVYSAQKISNCHSAPQDIYCVSLSSDSPTPNDRSEVHILRELLVDEMCRRKELESVIEAQRRVTDDFIARHEMQIQVIGRALDTTENMKNALEAQLLESQSTVLQLQMTVNECRAELVAIQNALKVEQGERARVDAMLEEIRRERENPAVPALATALSMINGLTSQALDK
ncbi:hypothetical protein BDY19DRAFT_725836 [Irpex rosettiformis]|uniref:Uncharacterized protein n=1 Tax=Irpex rosettiformis TaxID=378272 RepID=A0ACB8U8U6_9APHY|nr:hypothetical protein BDY19DRAFT_725836 [Irpex rosettiformis]